MCHVCEPLYVFSPDEIARMRRETDLGDFPGETIFDREARALSILRRHQNACRCPAGVLTDEAV